MPLQNRVTPFGAIIADPARGTLMGNRGCLHDQQQRPLRQYQVTRWIICLTAFKGRRRPLMAPGQYTELFCLDEATALAAGHRPCCECNRARFRAFAACWVAANPDTIQGQLRVGMIDAQLQRERISEARYQRDRRKRVYIDSIDGLPDGAFIALGVEPTAYLLLGARLFPWNPAGYGPPIDRPHEMAVTVLTPASTVGALAHGYRPALHPSVYEGAPRE